MEESDESLRRRGKRRKAEEKRKWETGTRTKETYRTTQKNKFSRE
jgi:hypothetical protein